MMSDTVWLALSSESNIASIVTTVSGIGMMRHVISVTSPNVPSLPTIMPVRS